MPYITLETTINKENRAFSVSIEVLEKYIDGLYLDVQDFMIAAGYDPSPNDYLYNYASKEGALINDKVIDSEYTIGQYITFDSFPRTFLEDGTENPNWDDELLLFTIPYYYFIQWLIDNDIDFDEFMDEYTWEDTYELYECADTDGKVIKEEVIERPF